MSMAMVRRSQDAVKFADVSRRGATPEDVLKVIEGVNLNGKLQSMSSLRVTEIAPPGWNLAAGTPGPNCTGGVKSMNPETMGEREPSSPGRGRLTEDEHVICNARS